MKTAGLLLLAAACVQARISGTATHNGDQDVFDNLMTDTSTTLQGGAKQVPLIHLSHDWVTQALIHAPGSYQPTPRQVNSGDNTLNKDSDAHEAGISAPDGHGKILPASGYAHVTSLLGYQNLGPGLEKGFSAPLVPGAN